MLRTLTIWLALISVALGSLNLSATTHRCGMSEGTSASGKCVCSHRGVEGRQGFCMRKMAKTCCTSRTIVSKFDPSVLSHARHLIAPPFVPSPVFAIAANIFGAFESPIVRIHHPPPQLAAQAQAAYLRNGSLLI